MRPVRLSGSFQAQYILHVVKTRGFAGEVTRGAQGPVCECRAASSLVCNFHSLAASGKQCGVIAHNVSAPHSCESDGGLLTLAGNTLAAENSVFREIAPKRGSDDLAQAQRGTGRRIDFESMMR